MTLNLRAAPACLLALTVALSATGGLAAPLYIEPLAGWVVHNQGTVAPTTSGLNTNSPNFAVTADASGMTVMADFGGMFPFGDSIKLHKTGDYLRATTTVTITGRALTGVNSLNTQLRIGLFNGPAGNPVAIDIPNVGLILNYTNAAGGGPIQLQSSLTQVNPFVGPTNIGNGTADAGGDSIQGANPGPVLFDMKITRNAGGTLDITGQISGTDSVSGNPYLSTFSKLNEPAASLLDVDGNFVFNRMAFLLGQNVRGSSTLGNVLIETNVPEPATWILGLSSLLGGVLVRRRSRGA